MKSTRVQNVIDGCVKAVVAHPIIVIVSVLLLAAATVPALRNMTSDFSYRVWFDRDDPILKAFDSFEEKFGNDDTTVVIVHSPSGIFDVESAKLLNNITKDLWTISQIMRVDSLSNFNWSRSEGDEILIEPLIPTESEEITPKVLAERKKVALEDPFLKGYLMSPDTNTAVLYATLQPMHTGTPDYRKIMNEIRSMLSKYQGQGDHIFHISGSAALNDAFYTTVSKDMRFNVPATTFMIFILLLACFRTIAGVILPFVVIWSSTLITFGIAALLQIRFNAMLSCLPNIIVAIGIADSVHVLSAFYQYRRSGLNRKEATEASLKKNFLPTLITSFTTSMGFLSLMATDIMPIQQFGFLTALGTMLAWVMSMAFLAPFLCYLPLGLPKTRFQKAREGNSLYFEPSKWTYSLINWIRKWRRPVIATFAVGTVSMLIVGFQNEVNSNPYKTFREGVPIQQANSFLIKNFGAVMGPEMIIDSGSPDGAKDPEFMRKVDAYEEWLRSLPYVTKTVSIVDIVKKTHFTLNRNDPAFHTVPDTSNAIAEEIFLYQMNLPQGLELNNRITLDHQMIRLTVLWTLQNSKDNLEAMAVLKKKSEEMGLKMDFAGKQLLHQMMNSAIVKTFYSSMIIVFIGIWILMITIFKSFKKGSFAMLPNVVPIILGGGITYLIGHPIDLGTVLIFSICLGIAVDDTVHFFVGYETLIKKGFTPYEAVARVFSTVAPALIVTTFILVFSFSMFLFADFVPTVTFGMMTAIVLVTALLCDIFLLPAILIKPTKEASPAKEKKQIRTPSHTFPGTAS